MKYRASEYGGAAAPSESSISLNAGGGGGHLKVISDVDQPVLLSCKPTAYGTHVVFEINIPTISFATPVRPPPRVFFNWREGGLSHCIFKYTPYEKSRESAQGTRRCA